MTASPAPNPKNKQLPLDEKLDIIAMKDQGATFAKITSDKNMLESTVRGIYSRRDPSHSQNMRGVWKPLLQRSE